MQEAPGVGLTFEEEQALRALSLGHTDEVAAAALEISLRTLRRRVRDAMDKLGARSRFQAGVLFAGLAGARGSDVTDMDAVEQVAHRQNGR